MSLWAPRRANVFWITREPISMEKRHVSVRPLYVIVACMMMPTAKHAIAANHQPAVKPNIVLFLVDDMGWMDSGAYGSEFYETPHIDALAANGMLFTDAHSAHPLSSPARASILTGRSPTRIGITSAEGHLKPVRPEVSMYPKAAPRDVKTLSARSLRYLPPEEITIAEQLREVGYRTAHIGKWHLGVNQEHWASTQGFDVAIHGAPDAGPNRYFSPYHFENGTLRDGPYREYLTDRLTADALRFIDETEGQPFFLHLSHYAVHGPWGYEPTRAAHYVRKVDPRGAQKNAVMGAMLESVDASLGRVLAKLDARGLRENTFVLFLSDNGGNVHGTVRKNRLPPTNNAPLRRGMGDLYEGGVRIPFIVRWPGIVEEGSRSGELVSTVDVFPTLLEVAGAPLPADREIDGESLIPVLRGERGVQRDALYTYFPHSTERTVPGASIRAGRWKLLRWFETTREYQAEYELYDLENDLGETQNVAAADPERVRSMNERLEDWLVEVDALLPIPNPAHLGPAILPPFLGWHAQDATTSAHNGFVRVAPTSTTPRIAISRLGTKTRSEPFFLHIRLRSKQAGDLRLEWRVSGQPRFDESVSSSATLGPGREWQDLVFQLTLRGELQQLRLFLPGGESAFDIQSISLVRATENGEQVRRWDFSATLADVEG